MSTSKTILVGVDMSAANRRACDYACDLAAGLDARLLLAQIIEPFTDVVPEKVMASIEAMTTDGLNERAARLRPYVRSVGIAIGRGEPWQGLSLLAVTHDVELVVVGTFGRRGVSRALLGSVAEKVVRTSPRAVITVPAHAFANRTQAGKRLAPALEKLHCPAPSVIALSRGSVPVAVEVARALDAPLDLWITQPIVAGAKEFGVVGEDGIACFDRTALDLTADECALAEKDARERLSRETKNLRGTTPMGEVWKRTAILVSDGLTEPAAIIAASRAMKTLGADRIIAAAPVITRAALVAIAEHCDGVAYIEAAIVADRADCWYRHTALPTARSARATLMAHTPHGILTAAG